MQTIYKYEFAINDYVTIQMPKGSRILKVGTQQEIPCIWVLCDPDNELVDYKFRIYGTGHKINEDETIFHIGTFQMYTGQLVWHMFIVLEGV